MVEIFKTDVFDRWLVGLRDLRGAVRVQARIDRLALGNPGDVRPVGGGISEMRIDFGPGYRVYFMRRGQAVIVLLAGGEKSSQAKDIERAKAIAAIWLEN